MAKTNTRDRDLGFVVEKNDNYFITDRAERGFCKDSFQIGDSLIFVNGECAVNKKQEKKSKAKEESNMLEGGDNV